MTNQLLILSFMLTYGCVFSEPDQKPAEPNLPVHHDVGERREISDPYHQFIFFAVLEGLYQDGLRDEAIDLIIPRCEGGSEFDFHEHFVYACPLCHPAFEAFRLYRLRPRAFYGDKGDRHTFGNGLDEDSLARLRSGDHEKRMEVITELIQRWTAHRLKLMRTTAKEREAWKTEFEKRKKRSMGILKQFQAEGHFEGKYSRRVRCAACDGTVEGAKVRGPGR